MKKCLIWGIGKCFNQYANFVKCHEAANHFRVIGVTARNSLYSEIRGYKYISKSKLRDIDFDFVIIMADGKTFREIQTDILNLGVSEEKIFSYRVLIHPNFDVDKYMRLKKNPPSIFSNSCWGGVTYHSLCLEFRSPLINMHENTDDYLKLLKDPKRYMNEELVFVKTYFDDIAKIHYPLVRCGDIFLYFNHYDSFEYANACWERRKRRIDWDNLFVMMHTEEPREAEEFTKLPYKRKVCFVPFESEEESLVYVEFHEKNKTAGVPFWKSVSGMADGEYPYYDVIDLLENGRLTKIVDVL